MHDDEIIDGLTKSWKQRAFFEKELYQQYQYFIGEGCRKYNLDRENSFSAYSDTVLAAIHNITENRFDNQVSLKTYLFQIFHNKCVDLIRKITTNKQRVHHFTVTPDLLSFLPEQAKNAVEKLIVQEKIALVAKHLETVGEKCREILLLFEDGYSDQEIAEKLAYNSAAVAKTTRLRCREKLKNLLIRNE